MPRTPSAKKHRQLSFRPRIDPVTSLWKDTDNFQNFIHFLVEAVRNERDAWTNEECGNLGITIQFVRRGRNRVDLLVFGNGVGVSNEGLEAIVCMNISPSASDDTKRGKTGTGAKAGCWHCKSLRVMTIRRGESTMLQIGYSWTGLVEMWKAGDLVHWDEVEIPVDTMIPGHGTCFVFEDLGNGENVDTTHDRSVKRVIAELAQELPPELTETITVIDTRGKSYKLDPRRIHGDKIEGVESLPNVGQVAYVISVTEKRAQKDELSMWAHDTLGSISAFLRRIRPTAAMAPLLDAVSVTLDHPHVIGYIAIPAWNKFVTSNRGTWKQALFDDEKQIFALLKWLYSEIVPLIEAKIGQDRSQVLSDNETLRNEIVEAFQRVGGVPETDRNVADIELGDKLGVSTTRIMLEPGMQIDLSILDPQRGVTYVWNDSEALGDLNQRRGTRVTFTAGAELGRGHITVTAGKKHTRMSTEIVRELPFSFTVASRHGEPEQRITHTLQFTHHLVGKPTWNVQGAGGRVLVAEDGLSAVHTLDETESTYEVSVCGVLKGGRKSDVTCTIFVARKGERPPRTRKTSRSEWIWDGNRYELAIRNYRHGDQARIASWLWEAAKEEVTRIVLNFAQPIFQGTDRVRRSSAIMQIALCIAQDQVRRNPMITEGMQPGEWVRVRSAEICAQFMDASAHS